MSAFSIALVGNPNVGKTTLYNRLTRSSERVGNWHGVTVDEASKTIEFGGDEITITDLPGAYGLTAYSAEEEVTRAAILGGEYDVAVCVCEANNLARNLYFAVQLIEAGARVVVAVNMLGEIVRRGGSVDCERLSRGLGVPVVAASALKRSEAAALLSVAVAEAKRAESRRTVLPYLSALPLSEAEKIVGEAAERVGLNKTYACIKTLERDEFALGLLASKKEDRERVKALKDETEEIARLRYEFIEKATSGAIKSGGRGDDERSSASAFFGTVSGKIDRIVLNKYLALPIFLAITFAVIALTFNVVGGFLSEKTSEFITEALYTPAAKALKGWNAPPFVVGLVCDGIINGAGSVLAFLPQVALLFFFLALMEDSGYVSRVAFATDGFFEKIGLSGRSVFTMLTGLGCSAAAVLTSRGLEDEKTRKKTAILTPFISCSARLPVYSIIASAYFARGEVAFVFALYLLGAAVSVGAAAIMEKCGGKLKSGEGSFIMEMPPYRVPTIERVAQILWYNCKVFLVKVGSTVLTCSVALWLLSHLSSAGYCESDESFLATAAGVVAPAFAPLGFGNWRAVSALISGFVAKEAVASVIETAGGAAAIFVGAYPTASAAAFAAYTLLYAPCFATVGALVKEVGAKWTAFGLALSGIVAYSVAAVVRLAFVCAVVYPWTVALLAAACAVAPGAVFIKRTATCGGAACCKRCKARKNACGGR